MRSIAGGKWLHRLGGITLALLMIVGVFAVALPSRSAYAGLAPGNTWFLRVHKSLSGDGITDTDKAKAHHIKVVATLSLENPSNETNRAGFKETFESRYKNETGSSYTTEVDYDSEDPYIRFTYDNSVTIRNINSPSQLVAMYLNPPSGGPLNFSDLKITYTITEYDVGDYDVYINQEKLTPDADGNVTYTVTHNGAERINGYGIFNQQDKEEDIFINNHKGTDFKEWTIEKVDAVTGEKLNTTFEFMLRQRAGTDYHNNNLERITVKSGDKVMLPYPAVYDVNETQAPEGYVPIGANEYRYPIKFNIDGLGNITVTDSSGNYNVTVDESTATITIPNYKKEDYTGDIEIKKQVVTSAGGELPALVKDQEYTLDLEIKDTRSSWLFTINSKFGDVEFVSSKAQVTIKDGETITLKDIPIIETYYGYLNGEWKEITPNSADAVFGIKITEQDGSKYNLTPEGDYLVGEYPRQIIVPSALRQTKSVTLVNTIPVYDVTVSKTDAKSDAQIAGAKLSITDREGNVVDEWTTVEGESHKAEGKLLAGETYTLAEVEAPAGYEKAESIEFSVDEEGNILVGDEAVTDNTIVMKDEPIPEPEKPTPEPETPTPELSVAKTSETLDVAKVGMDVPYTIKVANSGKGDAKDVKVTDTLPEGLTYVSDDANGTADGQTVTWTVDVPAGETKTILLTAKVNEKASGKIVNKVAIEMDGKVTYPNGSGDEDEITVAGEGTETISQDDEDDQDTETPSKTKKTGTKQVTKRIVKAVKTGDETFLLAIIMLLALGLSGTVIARRR